MGLFSWAAIKARFRPQVRASSGCTHPLASLNYGVCPDCGQSQFIEGPSGGMAINIRCATCGGKFWFCPPFDPVRIDNADELYTRPPIDLRDYCDDKRPSHG